MQAEIDWASRPLSVAEQKTLLGISSVNTLKSHEQQGLLPEEFPISVGRKARHGADLKEIIDARAAGADDGQIRELVERQKVARKQWLSNLMGSAA